MSNEITAVAQAAQSAGFVMSQSFPVDQAAMKAAWKMADPEAPWSCREIFEPVAMGGTLAAENTIFSLTGDAITDEDEAVFIGAQIFDVSKVMVFAGADSDGLLRVVPLSDDQLYAIGQVIQAMVDFEDHRLASFQPSGCARHVSQEF